MVDENKDVKLPRVAIIICNYNYGQWLTDAIKSAACQDYPSKSVVVIDDCSTDDSILKVHSLCSPQNSPLSSSSSDEEKTVYNYTVNGAPVILIALHKNVGPSQARNIGINYVEEDHHLFQICDADDVMMPNKVSKFATKIIENPEVVGGVYADYIILNEYGVQSYESKQPYDCQKLTQECIIHSGCMFSRIALQKVGLYNPTLRTCEDYDLHLRVSDFFVYNHIAEPLTLVRNHSQNSTNTVAKEIWQENYQRVKFEFMRRKGLI